VEVARPSVDVDPSDRLRHRREPASQASQPLGLDRRAGQDQERAAILVVAARACKARAMGPWSDPNFANVAPKLLIVNQS